MLKLQTFFEIDYQLASGVEQRVIVEGAAFTGEEIMAYFISLRRFEVSKIDLAALHEQVSGSA